MTQPKILLVDDDRDLTGMLTEYLVSEGFDCRALSDGRAAIEAMEAAQFDAVVLDIMMPGTSGLEVLRKVRQHSDVPILMLTGRGDDIDRIVGLEMGADDYLGKPCNPRELAARIRAVLRRSQPSQNQPVEPPLSIHGIQLDSGTLTVAVQGQRLTLTSAEFKTLHCLMRAAGTVLSKQYLTETVLQRKLEAYDRAIDVHISRVRHKLASAGVKDVIKSVRGSGYQMISETDGQA